MKRDKLNGFATCYSCLHEKQKIKDFLLRFEIIAYILMTSVEPVVYNRSCV